LISPSVRQFCNYVHSKRETNNNSNHHPFAGVASTSTTYHVSFLVLGGNIIPVRTLLGRQVFPQLGRSFGNRRHGRLLGQFGFDFRLFGHEEANITRFEALGGLRCLAKGVGIPLASLDGGKRNEAHGILVFFRLVVVVVGSVVCRIL
jgi:hypothetical protein